MLYEQQQQQQEEAVATATDSNRETADASKKLGPSCRSSGSLPTRCFPGAVRRGSRIFCCNCWCYFVRAGSAVGERSSMREGGGGGGRHSSSRKMVRVLVDVQASVQACSGLLALQQTGKTVTVLRVPQRGALGGVFTFGGLWISSGRKARK